MDAREQLLDDLARVFAHAAVDALLLEQGAETTTPATGGTAAGVKASNNSRNKVRANGTRRRVSAATAI
jgi:hypothetical protein